MTQQLLHVLVVACIMYILTSGFTFFIRLRGTADFSYMAIVIFGGFTGVILTELGLHPVFALFASFLLSIGFTLFVLHIIKRLALIYFNIGTFALYALAGYLVINLPITGASYGKSVPAFTTLEM